MRYNKPQVTGSVSAVSTIQQQDFPSDPYNGVSKIAEAYLDSQPHRQACTKGAYEADE
jgi:hypothetical protein